LEWGVEIFGILRGDFASLLFAFVESFKEDFEVVVVGAVSKNPGKLVDCLTSRKLI
jgi:hypothetical protein